MSVPTHTKALDLAYIALMAALWGCWGAGGEPWPF